MKSVLFKYRQYVIVNRAGIVTEASEPFCNLTEYCREELTGITAETLFHSRLRLNLPYPFENPASETFLFTKSLQTKFVHIDQSRSGKSGHIVYQIYEIPNSRFEDKNKFVEQLLAENVNGVGVYSSDFFLIKANQIYLDYLAGPYHTRAAAVGRHMKELDPDFEGGAAAEIWKKVKERRQTCFIQEKRSTLPGGDSRYWNKTVTPVIEDGRVLYFVSVVHDITGSVLDRETIREQKIENDYKIKQNKEELDALLDNMLEGLIITDPQGYVLKINPTALRILGMESYVPTAPYHNYYKPYCLSDLDGNMLPLEKWPLARALSKEKFTNLELWLHFNKIDKEPCLCSFSGTPVYDDNGEIILCFVTFTDVTEQRVLQEQLIRAIKEKNAVLSEAMAFKDEFLYLITHEMKTPLAVISSALQAMNLVCGDMPYKAAKYLKTIRQNTNRQLRLVGNLLDIVRINTGAVKLNNDLFDIVYLTELIVNSIQPIAIQRGVQLNFQSDIKTKIISIDEEKVERILMNLLSNALKFTPRNKQVYVRVSAGRNRQKNMICISVRDEGIGIPKDKQSTIFERFGQVNSNRSRPCEGTGIGLYLVNLLVNAMDGYITLESDEETGSNFTVMLPVNKESLKSCPSPKKEADNGSNDSRLINELAIQFSDIYY